MKVLIVPDKFKGSLTAIQVCESVAKAVHAVYSDADIKSTPLADGGEGTCKILTRAHKGHEITLPVADPLGRTIEATYGVANGGKTAFIEMAAASGLQLLHPTERNPLVTSTYGTGQMIKDAIQRGASHIVLGIGGSATNDAGTGMAYALGYKFIDNRGSVVDPTGGNLITLSKIEKTQETSILDGVEVTVLCDVTNPLFGEQGTAFVFARQKGADPDAVKFLDDGLRHFAQLVKLQFNKELNFPGAGAAGGLGAGASLFLSGKLKSGIEYVVERLNLEQQIKDSDLVITGEGKLDHQSLSGKVVAGVCSICRTHDKPVVIVTGKNELNRQITDSLGNVTVLPLVSSTVTERQAISKAAELVYDSVSNFLRNGKYNS